MKRISALIVICLIMAGCKRIKQSDHENNLITVDVRSNYPQKELTLQEFMDVEYILLETSDEFLHQGVVLDIGQENIIIKNRINDGDIFIYNRNGKGVRKINRKGQGPGEYSFIFGITLDEENNEMFINDLSKGIMVYDLYGNFLRDFHRFIGAFSMSMHHFDNAHFLFFNDTWMETEDTPGSSFAIISKENGSIVKEIKIHYRERVDRHLTVRTNGMSRSVTTTYTPIIPFQDSWIITELSSDTIFMLSQDYSIIPFMVRTPSIHGMNPEIFFSPVVLTDRYYFLQTQRKEFDFKTNTGFPSTKLMYDRKEQKMYEYTVINDDYTIKKTIDFPKSTLSRKEIAFWQIIEAHELVESYEKGELKGKLKKIAATMDEEDNPVIMLIKNKK